MSAEIQKLERRLKREINARKEAEGILEQKALELYEANQNLRGLNKELESKVEDRTKALKLSEERFRSLIETATDVIFNTDKGGFFTYMNPTGLEVYGFNEDEVIGQHFADYIFEDDKQLSYQYFVNFLTSDELESYYEFRVTKKTGEQIWIGQKTKKLFIDNELSFTAVARDITERKDYEKKLIHAREALKKSELKYRSMIENMHIGIVETDLDGVVQRGYEQFCRMFQYHEDDIISKNINELLLSSQTSEKLFSSIDDREREVTEIELLKKDGTKLWVYFSYAPMFNELNEITGVVMVFFDIDDRKKLEKDLHTAKEVAEKAQQAEKHFLASMSHEIRTPLNAIIGMSHLLKDTKLTEDQSEYLDILNHSAKVLLGLISDILDISKIDAGRMSIQEQKIDLASLVKNMVKSFSPRLQDKGVEIKYFYDQDIDTLLVSDQTILNQILINLLGNSSKFTHEGHVKINIIQQQKYSGKRKILFEVIDTGIGISADKHDIIFDQFRQADSNIINEYGGTGLGLNITRKLVTLLGGDIKIESEIGKGSKFYFSIMMKDTGESITGIEAPTLSDISKSDIPDGHILVVEDNVMNQKYISTLLNRWNFSFDIANNGLEAVEICDQKHYDLIFMDLQMPILDGIAATKRIISDSTLNKATPIIALTASTFLSKKESALQAGMIDFLSKPFTPDQLIKTIKNYLLDNKETLIMEVKDDIFSFSDELDIDFLEEVYGDDMEYAKDIFEIFLETFEEEYSKLKDTIESQNCPEIKAAAHKMKPTFSMVGLTEFTEQFKNLETSALNSDLTTVTSTFEKVDEQLSIKIPLITSEFKRITEYLEDKS